MPGVLDTPNDFVFPLEVAALAAAGETPVWRAPYNGYVSAAYWIPSAAVVANGANFATLGLRNRGGAGAGAALPATRSYAAGNSAAFATEAMTLDPTVANYQFAGGDVLTVQSVETGAGLALPAGLIMLAVRWR